MSRVLVEVRGEFLWFDTERVPVVVVAATQEAPASVKAMLEFLKAAAVDQDLTKLARLIPTLTAAEFGHILRSIAETMEREHRA